MITILDTAQVGTRVMIPLGDSVTRVSIQSRVVSGSWSTGVVTVKASNSVSGEMVSLPIAISEDGLRYVTSKYWDQAAYLWLVVTTAESSRTLVEFTVEVKTGGRTVGAAYYPTEIAVADSPNLDAFSRLRVGSPVTLFSAQCQYDAEPLLLEGSGTSHSSNSRMVAVTSSSGTSYLQSYRYVPYQPGKSQLIFITGLFGSLSQPTDWFRFGLFDAANGIYYQMMTSGLSVVRRSSTSGGVVNDAVAQSDWNIDPLDGSGPSGKVLDQTTVFILVIDCQFLGMGRVRIGFDIDGSICYCHQWLNANSLAVPYMQTLTLPVRVETYFNAGA